MATAGVIILFPIMLLVLALPVFVGVYVYRDANKRGMNAPMWTLITILAPSLIGFIIYLLVRGNYSSLRCGNCDTQIKEYYVVCPKCGAKLRPSCPNCSTPIEPDWVVCPKCAQSLPEYQSDIVMPKRPKDNTLWKILIAVIVIPLILIVLLIAMFRVQGRSGGLSSVGMPIEQYLEDADEPRIESWLESCENDAKRAYVLRHEIESKETGEEQVRFLVYMPGLAEQYDYIPEMNDGLFGTTLDIHFENVDGETNDNLVLLSYTGDADAKLKLNLNGEKMEYEIEDVDFGIAPSDFID